MKTDIIGLDIGSSSVKVAKVKRNGKSFFLESIGTIPAPITSLVAAEAGGHDSVAQTIKTLLTTANVKTRSVALCLPENQVYTKVIEMPELSPRELSAALRYELEQYIPLPIDKVKTDWEILGRTESTDKKTMNVMLVAAPIALLSKYQEVMSIVGLTSETIETEIVSVYRSLLPLVTSPYSSMIVHMGAACTTVAIVRAGVIRMIFSINLGGLALTRSISIDLGIDMGQAENYKNAYGFNQDAFEGKIARVITPVLDQVVGDIKKGLLSYREKNNNESVKQVILSGGSALLPGIDAYLTNSLSTQVVVGSAFAAYNMENVPPELSAQAPLYNVVIGLAIRNLI